MIDPLSKSCICAAQVSQANVQTPQVFNVAFCDQHVRESHLCYRYSMLTMGLAPCAPFNVTQVFTMHLVIVINPVSESRICTAGTLC